MKPARGQLRRVDEAPAVPGRWIVKFQPGTPLQTVSMRDGVNATPLATTLVPDLYLLEGPDFPGTRDGWMANTDVQRLVEYIHPDYFVFLVSQQPTDADFPKQWGLEANKVVHVNGVNGAFIPDPTADIEAMRGWLVYKGSGKTTVAVVDTGLTVAAADLKNRLWMGAGKVGFDFVKSAGVTFDGDSTGHGTRVASIIGAEPNDAQAQSVVGVIQDCRLMPLRVFSTVSFGGKFFQSAPVSRVIMALDFAAKNGARVINNSYGAHKISDATGLSDAIGGLQLGGNDCLFVCAAGNSGDDLAVKAFYPASFDLPNMIAVTSTDSSDVIPKTSRNHGVGVDLAAPGENIWATGKYNYGYASGTSFATAFVSGAAALVWDYRPLWTAAEVKKSILDSVRTEPQFSGLVETGGVLNLGDLMELAQQYPAGPP